MSLLPAMRSLRNGLTPIMEDGAGPPALPERAPNRPQTKQFKNGSPSDHNFEYPPPAYSDTSAAAEKSGRIRNSNFVTRRGGWWRLLIILAALICVIGLAVGLGVGLTRHLERYA